MGVRWGGGYERWWGCNIHTRFKLFRDHSVHYNSYSFNNSNLLEEKIRGGSGSGDGDGSTILCYHGNCNGYSRVLEKL